MSIIYTKELTVQAEDAADVFDAADFPDESFRFDVGQVAEMISNSNLVITARDEGRLAGIALSMSNYVSLCYLCSFAVHPDYKNKGVGKNLISKTREVAGGEKITFITLSTPASIGFYESIGLERCRNAFIAPRSR